MRLSPEEIDALLWGATKVPYDDLAENEEMAGKLSAAIERLEDLRPEAVNLEAIERG